MKLLLKLIYVVILPLASLFTTVWMIRENAGVAIISINIGILILLIINAVNYAALFDRWRLIPYVSFSLIPGIGFLLGYDKDSKEFTLILLFIHMEITWSKSK
jgi:hypothetical protein